MVTVLSLTVSLICVRVFVCWVEVCRIRQMFFRVEGFGSRRALSFLSPAPSTLTSRTFTGRELVLVPVTELWGFAVYEGLPSLPTSLARCGGRQDCGGNDGQVSSISTPSLRRLDPQSFLCHHTHPKRDVRDRRGDTCVSTRPRPSRAHACPVPARDATRFDLISAEG